MRYAFTEHTENPDKKVNEQYFERFNKTILKEVIQNLKSENYNRDIVRLLFESGNPLNEKLKLYLKNLDGAYSKLVPSGLVGSNKEDIQKLKADFKLIINTFYKQHKMAVELAENTNDTD